MRFIGLLIFTLLISSNCNSQENKKNNSEKTRIEKWKEDISYFENEFLSKAKTYTEQSKASCETILAALKTNINKLTDFQIRLELSRCVVLADNGHTESPPPLMDKIPLRFYRFSDGIHVVKTDSSASEYLGAKVLKINGGDVNGIEERLFPYLSGIDRWKKFKTIDLITAPRILHELQLSKKDTITVILVKNKDTLNVSFRAKKIKNDRYWFEAWANLYPVRSKENQWRFIQKGEENLPRYIKRAEEGVFYEFDDRNKIAYFHINSFWNKQPDLKTLVDDFVNKLKEKKDYNVVIDIRFYTGGNYGFFTKLASKPPKIIDADKKIYLIISDKTYSAGIVTAARVKHYAKDKIVIVGEDVGDRLKFWAEGELVQLPHSGIRIYNAKKEHDWKDNKRSLSRTHKANFIYGVAAKDLKLDKEIQFSFKDYMENKDPILEWIISQHK